MSATSGQEGVDNYHGKRTLGSKIEDQAIESKIRVNLQKKLPTYSKSYFKIVSFNGIVLLLGQVRDQKSREFAEKTAKQIRHVKTVHNKLTINSPTSFGRKIADSWMTYKIKSQFLFSENFPASRVKVVTVDGIVYMMGLLTEAEADQATEIARRATGVKKVVKVFEFIDPAFSMQYFHIQQRQRLTSSTA